MDLATALCRRRERLRCVFLFSVTGGIIHPNEPIVKLGLLPILSMSGVYWRWWGRCWDVRGIR